MESKASSGEDVGDEVDDIVVVEDDGEDRRVFSNSVLLLSDDIEQVLGLLANPLLDVQSLRSKKLG